MDESSDEIDASWKHCTKKVLTYGKGSLSGGGLGAKIQKEIRKRKALHGKNKVI